MALDIQELASFCKKKGFVYQSSEIYGGFSGFFDYGPLGVELFKNIKKSFWDFFVRNREDVVGIEASIISHPRTWKASGHIESFGDLIISCRKCKDKFRADHIIEEKLSINVEGASVDRINTLIKDKGITCPECGSEFEELKDFNLLFKTEVGAQEGESSTAYLRGETAQGMFLDFKPIVSTTRLKLPFGIAQIGKCFRNEIAPRNFLFRAREFTIGEWEYFIHPEDKKCDLLDEQEDEEINFLSSESQEKGKNKAQKTLIKELISKGKLGEWHAYWLAEQVKWLKSLNIDKRNLKIREHTKTELSHYSSATFDIDYNFPFGSKEVAGNANRGQYDLKQHMEELGDDLSMYDSKTQKKVIPRVIEPTFGMSRVFLAVICDAFNNDEERGNIVLKLNPKLAPYKVAVFPLVNKGGLEEKARDVFEDLNKSFSAFFDRSGSIGRRYARQDEIGTPYCVTIDFDTLKDDSVTIRDRNNTEQIRVKISELKNKLGSLIENEG